MIIPPTFNTKAKFVSGFAQVEIGTQAANKTIIDKTGRAITKSLFLDAHNMSENLAVVEMVDFTDKSPNSSNRAQTYIDPSGSILKDKFAVCGDFFHGVAVAKMLEWFFNGWMAVISYKTEGHYGRDVLIDRQGHVLRDLPGGAYSMNFSEGFLPVITNNLIGYIDTTGGIVIKPHFSLAKNFSEGLAAVCSSEDDRKWGFIDRQGKTRVQYVFMGVEDFHEGLAKVNLPNTSMYIDTTGKTVIQETEQYKILGNFSEGLAAVTLEHFGVGFIDHHGKLVIEVPGGKTFGTVGEFHNGLCCMAVLKDDRLWFGFIDKSGRWAVQPLFSDATDFSEGLAAVRFADTSDKSLKQCN